MKKLARRFRFISAWLACLGWLLPLPEAHSSEPVDSGAALTRINVVHDVCLGRDGLFSGRLLDPSGAPLAGQTVQLEQTGKTLAKSRSSERGEFSFDGVRGGVYQITIGASAVACRAWTQQAAPPAATTQLAIVTHPDVIRGQQPISEVLTNPLVIGLIIAAAIAIPVAIHQSQDDAS